MEVNSIAVQLALLFVPGLIWAMIDAAHRPPSDSGQFLYTLRVFVFGVICYSFVGTAYALTHHSFDVLIFTSDGWKLKDSIDELFWASITSLVLSILWLYGRTHKIVTRFLNYIGASRHIADQDIWEFMFNSDDPKVKYVHIRDYENKLVYAGYVTAFSERMDLREVAMYDVIIYNDNGEEISKAPYLYLARDIKSITLELHT